MEHEDDITIEECRLAGEIMNQRAPVKYILLDRMHIDSQMDESLSDQHERNG